MPDLNEEYVRFCDLLLLAEEYFADRNFSAAVRVAQIAARYAYPGNAGIFGSPRLERLLLELGKQLPRASPCSLRCRGESSRNVLHVLSYGRPIGGDSRFVWRWIQEDRNSRHFVAITTQADLKGVYEVPEILRQSAESSGGFLWTPTAPTSTPMDQARELRALCQEMDIVVLHLFPYDIVPLLALATDCGTVKTLFVNHSDHTFWIGASVAHSIVHLRRQPPNFLINRRGLNTEKSMILPIPLDFSPSSVTRVQAKHELGFEPDVVLLLTIASPFKYSSPGQISFLDLVTPVLAENSQAVLLAVGPDPKDDWRLASIRTEGRIMPLGTQWNNDLLYAAADIYLDSVPFSSITSVLEAGIQGLPILGYSPNSELDLLGAGAPGLDNNVMEMGNDVDSYQTLLTRLICDAEFRHQSGLRVQTQILSLHTGSNWIHTVHDLYAKVDRIDERNCLMASNDTFETSALNLALVLLYSPWNTQRMIRNYIGVLPYRSRLKVTWRLYIIGFDLCLSNLIPPPVHGIVLATIRWAKRAIRQLGQSR